MAGLTAWYSTFEGGEARLSPLIVVCVDLSLIRERDEGLHAYAPAKLVETSHRVDLLSTSRSAFKLHCRLQFIVSRVDRNIATATPETLQN